MKTYPILSLILCLIFCSCRKEPTIFIPETEQKGEAEFSSVLGFYLLNEGNMGSNKSTLDYYDFSSGTYHRNIYASVNPTVPKELGDVGNDIKIYGSKMYAVINCSNKIEVMDAKTAKRIGQINLPNCRYITFDKGFAYVSSYAGPVEINPNYQQRGLVAKIDTSTLQITAQCLVGFQPDELVVCNKKLYVANSGGYMVPNYENTVSVIELSSFKEIKRIEVAINLHRIRADQYGQLWLSSRGDYYHTPSRLYCINSQTDRVVDSLAMPVSNFCIDQDKLYAYSVEWNYNSMRNETSYGVVDIKSKQMISRNFITDGSEKNIKVPYGIAVHPITKDIFVTDAKNYVSPGTLYCFDKTGKQKWKVRTGDIPAHFVFFGNYKN